jgi:DNA-binding NarL/FixJ family response regulator
MSPISRLLGDELQPVSDAAAPMVSGTALTAVQREVVDLIAQGHSNQAIADRLGLARVTVSHHVATILWRLDLQQHHEIAIWALNQRYEDHR